MNVKLIDVRYEEEQDVEFGTCELCFYTGDLSQEYLIFQDNEGKTTEIETGQWSWGDYDIIYHFDNVVDFGSFINSKNIKTLEELEEKFDELYEEYLSEKYN